MRKSIVVGVISGAFLIGSAGAALILPAIATAADPSASPATPAAPTTNPSGGTNPCPGDHRGPGGHGGFGGGPNELVSDASVVAKAIGISEADLTTALQGGQTVAAVAKAHNVAVQTVIDALVADGKSELDAAVKAGTITQAQADAQAANLVQRVTDQVNGTMRGPGGHGGFGGWGPRGGTPNASPSASPSTTG